MRYWVVEGKGGFARTGFVTYTLKGDHGTEALVVRLDEEQLSRGATKVIFEELERLSMSGEPIEIEEADRTKFPESFSGRRRFIFPSLAVDYETLS